MIFSIIIATCDRPERLAKCLDAVAVAIKAHGEEDRVIVVDNGRTEERNATADERGCTQIGNCTTEYTRLRPAGSGTTAWQAESPAFVPLMEKTGLRRGKRRSGEEGMMAGPSGRLESGADGGNRKPDSGIVRERVCDSAVAPDSLPASRAIMPSDPRSSAFICGSNSSADSAPLREITLSPVRSVVTSFSAKTGIAAKYLRTEPRNKAKALNVGIAAADTEWLAFTDDDCLPDSEWLKNADSFIRAFPFRVFGAQIVAGLPEQPVPGYLRPGPRSQIPNGGVFVYYAPVADDGQLPDSAPAPFGANIFVRADVFREHGGYDEKLWNICGRSALGSEDGDFGIRLKHSGEPIGYCRGAIVIHPVHSDKYSLARRIRHVFKIGWRAPLVSWEPNQPPIELYRYRLLALAGWRVLKSCVAGDFVQMRSEVVGMAGIAGSILVRFSQAYRLRSTRRLISAEGGSSSGGDHG